MDFEEDTQFDRPTLPSHTVNSSSEVALRSSHSNNTVKKSGIPTPWKLDSLIIKDIINDLKNELGNKYPEMDKEAVLVIPLNPGRNFTYQELCAATDNFSRQSFLGEGGFGPIHKGVLEHNIVSVKKLEKSAKNKVIDFWFVSSFLHWSITCMVFR